MLCVNDTFEGTIDFAPQEDGYTGSADNDAPLRGRQGLRAEHSAAEGHYEPLTGEDECQHQQQPTVTP